MYSRQPRFLRLFLIFLLPEELNNLLKNLKSETFLKVATVVKHLDCQFTAYYKIFPACLTNHLYPVLLFTILIKYP